MRGTKPKYLDYDGDLGTVIGIKEYDKSGRAMYEVDCAFCDQVHIRDAKHLKQGIKSRECEFTKPPNWSGFDREDAIIQRMYGITMAELDGLVEFQKGNCAVCFKPLEILNRRANIDHDHETGEVRGILCTGCNTGIGHLGDNIAGLERALYYLKNTPFSEFKETK